MIQDSNTPPTASLADDGFAIQVNALNKTYSEGLIFKKKFKALTDVSFDVNRGEIFGLLGPNGAGKTTFIKILLGIIRKSSGNATMLGQVAGSRAGRRLVGYLPEHLRIPAHLNGYTALECYGSLSNVPKSVIRKKRDGLLDLVGLTGREKDRCKKYSKGMLQRLGLAQALLHDPKLLVLDEPTDGLDPQARAEMRQIIRRLKDSGVTIFLNSHILQEVEMICDRVAILNRGLLEYCGAVDDIGDFVKQKGGSTKTGIVVDTEVSGSPTEVNEAFTGFDFEILTRGADVYTVRTVVGTQTKVDELVDSLRKHKVSLHSMSRHQASLEDAFLQIISGTPGSTAVNAKLDGLFK